MLHYLLFHKYVLKWVHVPWIGIDTFDLPAVGSKIHIVIDRKDGHLVSNKQAFGFCQNAQTFLIVGTL